MARPLEVRELIPELQFWIKHPTDPSLRKLLRKTVQTLQAFQDLVGEPDVSELPEHTPALPDRIKQAE